MKETSEQLNTLLEQFADKQTAGQMSEDIRQADQLLTSIPAPTVSLQTLRSIKSQVHGHLAAKLRLRTRAWLASAAGIALIVGGTFFVRTHQPVIPTESVQIALASAIWDDDSLGPLQYQVESIAGQVESLNGQSEVWFEEDAGLGAEIDDLQTIALTTDFWKG